MTITTSEQRDDPPDTTSGPRATLIRPWASTDVAALVQAGWQWCGTRRTWFQVIGRKKYRGCREGIGVEMDQATAGRAA